MIFPGVQVRPERDLRLRVEIGEPGDITLSMLDEDGFPFPVDMIDAGHACLCNTNACRVKEVHERFVTQRITGVPDVLQLNPFHGFPWRLFLLDRRDSPDRVYGDNAFLNAPFKEAIQDAAGIADCRVLLTFLLAEGKIMTNVCGRDGWYGTVHGTQEPGHNGPVKLNCPL